MANSFGGGEMGEYTLSLVRPGVDVGGGSETDPGTGGDPVLRDGATASGSLTSSDLQLDDGSYYDEWSYMGQAGERVTVTMTSDAVDPYLLVFQGSSLASGEYLTEDDDSGGGLNAQITLTLPSAGIHLRSQYLQRWADGQLPDLAVRRRWG